MSEPPVNEPRRDARSAVGADEREPEGQGPRSDRHPEGRPGAERLSRRTIYAGRAVDLSVDHVRLPNGREADMEVVHHRGSAAVLPLLVPGARGGRGAEEEVVLVRQFRYTTGRWLLEIPAGKLDADEPPEVCARRELEEETGWKAGRLEPLGWIWTTPGTTDERIWLYLASDLTPAEQRLEEDEIVEVERLPLAVAVERAESGEIHDAKTVCALLRLAARRRQESTGSTTQATKEDG